ncbi:MAG: ThiF family adenylyltransferase, partial [Dehalococcoidia bacterium]|nr:ThiF family adenylyltransferase [Dehalococcoidia bacterium]
MRSAALQKQGKSVAVVGAGGNIGSHILEHIARMPEVTRVRLIDKDIYERKHLLSQSITPSDVGRAKAIAQPRRLRAIRSDLCIEPIAKGVEELPLGTLHCDAIVACLDSLWSRQVVNAAAWRLGVPWIDGGVNTGHLLA